MTNLTERWEKGKLPDGFYWIEFQDGEILSTTFSNQHRFICCDVICDEENIKQILAEMPSYEQWQAKLEENTKLKELLKECKALLSCLQIDDYDGNGLLVLNKINKVLGEE